MRWDVVLQALGEVAAADPVLAALYPDQRIRQAGTAAFLAPVLEFLLIGDVESELWAPCTVQWDIYHTEWEAMVTTERRLRRLFNEPLPVTVAGVLMWCQYVDGDTLARPDRDGYYGRAVRFRHTPLRERYDASTPPA